MINNKLTNMLLTYQRKISDEIFNSVSGAFNLNEKRCNILNAVTGAVSPEGTVAIQSASAKTIAGSKLYITCYTKEYFVDTQTGKVSYDVEDSLGTLKSIANYQYVGGFQ